MLSTGVTRCAGRRAKVSANDEVELLGAIERYTAASVLAAQGAELERVRKLVFVKVARDNRWPWKRIGDTCGVTETAIRTWWKRNMHALKASDARR